MLINRREVACCERKHNAIDMFATVPMLREPLWKEGRRSVSGGAQSRAVQRGVRGRHTSTPVSRQAVGAARYAMVSCEWQAGCARVLHACGWYRQGVQDRCSGGTAQVRRCSVTPFAKNTTYHACVKRHSRNRRRHMPDER